MAFAAQPRRSCREDRRPAPHRTALHRTALREPDPDTSDTDADSGTDNHTDNGGQAVIADIAAAENPLVIRTRERYAAVHDLLAGGETIAAICRQLSLDRNTVQRHARAEHVDERLGKARSRGSLLDRFEPYLHERFNAGYTDAAQLTTELADLGYWGIDKTARRYLHPFRATLVAPPPTPVPSTVRRVTGWVTRDPDALAESDTMQLKQILARSPALDVTHEHIRDFAKIMTNLQGHAYQTGWPRSTRMALPP